MSRLPDYAETRIREIEYFSFRLPVTVFGYRDDMVVEISVEHCLSGTGQINLKLFREGQHAVLIVANNGALLTAEKIEVMREPFVSGNRNGLGLGLSIVVLSVCVALYLYYVRKNKRDHRPCPPTGKAPSEMNRENEPYTEE